MPLIQLPSADTNKVPDKDNLGFLFFSSHITLRLDLFTLLFGGVFFLGSIFKKNCGVLFHFCK
jgi:hypothetical protein